MSTIATADCWKNLIPFGSGLPLPFASRYDAAEFSRIAAGFIPEQMEDKWFVHYAEPNLYFHRSWTGEPVYRVTLVPDADGAVVTQACWSDTFARDEATALHYESQLLDFLIANLLLGQRKPFPRPAGQTEAAPGIFQHHIAGTGYPEVVVAPPEATKPVVAAKKPWWRFW